MNNPCWKSLTSSLALLRFTGLFAALCCAQTSAVGQSTEPAAAGTDLKATETIDLGGGVTMEFVLIKPGSFTMGSDRNQYDERPAHKVTLTKPYYIGKYEVTQEQWEKVMGENPSHFKGAKHPVENVSWEDCQRFLAEVRKKIGRRFALPTEAQWEYACRAGTTTAYSSGDDNDVLSEHAWHSGNSELTTHPVGQKKPNPWGLYDMHGNVFEWCADWYSDAYPDGEATDPRGEPTGTRRVIRGGAWLYVLDNQRSADRGFSPPDYRVNEYGLRCVILTGEPVPGDADLESSAHPEPAKKLDPVEATFAQLDAAVASGNKLYAEMLLAEAGKNFPDDARLTALRDKVAELSAPQETLVVEIADGVRMEFVLIRPGTFSMGSSEGGETPHPVTITKPFYLGKFEVTQKQWVTLMTRNLSTFRATGTLLDATRLPVENVNWLLCQSFFQTLNQKLPGYNFRLPTEAEWEYACRAGTTSPRYFADENELDAHAWYGGNSDNRTHPVGLKKPNPWGLHDMYGNVWEWCQDAFGPYPTEAVTDPKGPSGATSGLRVLRGGAWNNIAKHVNSTFRHDAGSNVGMRYYGFRCAVDALPMEKK